MNSKMFIGIVLLTAGILIGWYILGDGFTPVLKVNDLMQKNTVSSISPTPTLLLSVSEYPSSNQKNDREKGGNVPRVVVTYTDSGFAPSPLNVIKGTTVTFVNESSGLLLVASAQYPTHQVLPSFVQKTSVGKNGIYEYTFTEVGTWKYQNDTKISDSGSVIVSK